MNVYRNFKAIIKGGKIQELAGILSPVTMDNYKRYKMHIMEMPEEKREVCTMMVAANFPKLPCAIETIDSGNSEHCAE